jgi:hypothetical protein
MAAAARGDIKRSRSSILRTYGSGNALADRRPSNTQRGAATLAVLGDDNPTLIIRDRKAGEEAFENFFQGDDSDSDEGGPVSSIKPQSAQAAAAPGRPWKAISTSGAGGQGSEPGGYRLGLNRITAVVDDKMHPCRLLLPTNAQGGGPHYDCLPLYVAATAQV